MTVRGARLDYGGAPLFEDLELTLRGGAWTCLLGPSGVGKTSLLRVFAGLAPRPGTTAGDGRITCSDGLPLGRRAAYMAQQDLLLPWLSALDNVTLGARLRGERLSEAAGRARRLLADVGLAGKERALPAALSGGQRQRVALARTLMEARPVVLMDEPFSALDAITRHRLQSLAARLLAGRTVLLVTHDPLEALRLGHRIHVMAGRPARLDRALEPSGATPRDPREVSVGALHAELMERLAAADAMAANGPPPEGLGPQGGPPPGPRGQDSGHAPTGAAP
ncbi:MAG: ABC transporter ATP-binding protein [Alphaproteobacteria bacterium]